MEVSILPGVLGGFAAIAVCFYIAKSLKRAAQPGKLRTSRVVLGIGILGAIGCMLVLSAAVAGAWREEAGAILLLCLFLGGMASWGFLEYFRAGGSFDEQAIEFTGLVGAPVRIPYSAIALVTYSPFAGWYVIHAQDGSSIRLRFTQRGYGDALDAIERFGIDVPETGFRRRQN